MDRQSMARRLVAALGETLTVSGLAFEEPSNSCVLVFDGDLIVNIEYDDPAGRLVLSAWLDELPKDGAEPLLRELMAANLYWHRTRGATLALEEGTNGVILTWGASVTELDAHSFETAVENFVNRAEHWRNRMAASAVKAAIATSTPPAAPGAGLIYG
jgi:hypothetical protein